MKKGLVQVAGVVSAQETADLVKWQPEAIGIPYALEGRKEDLDHLGFLAAVKQVPNSLLSIWITYLTQAPRLIEIAVQSGVTGIQLHGEMSVELMQSLRKALPELMLFKSLIVGKYSLAELKAQVVAFAPYADAFLTDTWEVATQKSGATGKTHDWLVSKELVKFSPRPLILAGGLNPENVYDAILCVMPWGVDSHTGLEGADGRKDAAKVLKFISESKRAYAALETSALNG